MAKLPGPPAMEFLKALHPPVKTLATGTALARIYSVGGRHGTAWNTFRHFGPVGSSRFDHLQLNASDQPCVQSRSILYAAPSILTCLAEVFQDRRVINKFRDDRWVAVFEPETDLPLLDLTGNFVTRMGASTALHSGPKSQARKWALALYEAFPHCDGIAYCSSMNGNALAIALTDRAERRGVLPKHPAFNRSLADATLTDLLAAAADTLGYTLTT